MQKALTISLVSTMISTALMAQTPTLIKDINTKGLGNTSSFAGQVRSNYFLPMKNDKTFFFANLTDSPYEDEAFVTDGTAAGTSMLGKNLYAQLSGHTQLYDAKNNRVYFTSRENIYSTAKANTEVWLTDGTAAGTKILKDFSGTESSNPELYAVIDGKLFFKNYQYASAKGFYVSDGTDAGTVLLTDKEVFRAVAFKGKMYMSVAVTTFDNELWESDGTVAGTKKLWASPNGSIGSVFATTNNLYLQADGFLTHFNLSTKAATKILDTQKLGSISYGGVVTMGGKDYFLTSTYSFGPATLKNMLYVTDGTIAGTKPIKELPNYLEQAVIVAAEKFIAFAAQDAQKETELWLSDGTAAGTISIDLNKDTESFPRDLCRAGNRIYFSADYKDAAGKAYGRELMITDGTAAGTKLALDINPTKGSDVKAITYTTYKGKPNLLFYASPNDQLGLEPHRMDISLVTPSIEILTESNLFSVYPNPSQGTSTLKLTTTENATLRIFDISGKLLQTQTIAAQNTTLNLSKGINILQLTDNQGNTQVKKVVVE